MKDIEKWEKAFHEYGKKELEEGDLWGIYGLYLGREIVDEDYGGDSPLYYINEVAADSDVGGVTIDFPNSQHGDAVGATIYNLSHGRFVIIAGASYGLSGVIAIYLDDVDDYLEMVLDECSSLAYSHTGDEESEESGTSIEDLRENCGFDRDKVLRNNSK